MTANSWTLDIGASLVSKEKVQGLGSFREGGLCRNYIAREIPDGSDGDKTMGIL